MAADASPILAPLVKMLKIVAGPFTFRAQLEEERAPRTAAAIRAMLPFKSKLVHCKWSGESTWVPMGDTKVGGPEDLAFDNHTIHPALVEPGASSADGEIDARGLFALPGIVDAHVHFNDPGRADWEGWASGSRAAAAGGVTTVIDMPLNSLPPVLDGASFDAKRAAG